MCGPFLSHLHGEGQLECETEPVGNLKNGEFGWQSCCASTGNLIIAHLEGQSLLEVLSPSLQTHALTKMCLCVCQVASSSDSSVRFIDMISS